MTENMSAELIAKRLRQHSGRGRLLLIGPVRVYVEPQSGQRMYAAVAITHDKSGRECLFDRIIFFGAVARICDDCAELAAAADVDGITATEADLERDHLIGVCRSYFKRIRVFESERALADAMVEFFPGAKSERAHAATYADPNSI
jgi:hypothetical protein